MSKMFGQRGHLIDSLMISGYCIGTALSSASFTRVARSFMYAAKLKVSSTVTAGFSATATSTELRTC